MNIIKSCSYHLSMCHSHTCSTPPG